VQTEKTLKAQEKIQNEIQGNNNLVSFYVDLLNEKEIEKVILTESPDVIIHLAAIVSPPCYSNPVIARKINVDGTAVLISAALKLSTPPLFVFASSSAVYGSRNP
jgi:nucleoside-diphosphate-sugar epimerase